jgi:hypothetical protein
LINVGPSANDISAVQTIFLLFFFYLFPETVTHNLAEYIFRRCPDLARRE